MKTKEQIELLHNDYIVVKFYDEDSNETTMKVTKRNNFEETNLCECYGKYGQKVGCWNSGCYSLANPDSDAMKDLIAAIEEKFDVTPGIVECPDGSFEVEPDSETEDIEGEINRFIKRWQEENEYHSKAEAWTYFDSSNFRTVILKYYDSLPFNVDCEELSKEEQIAILSEMPELPYHVEGTNASEKTENYTFYFDRGANNPWICFVEKNDN